MVANFSAAPSTSRPLPSTSCRVRSVVCAVPSSGTHLAPLTSRASTKHAEPSAAGHRVAPGGHRLSPLPMRRAGRHDQSPHCVLYLPAVCHGVCHRPIASTRHVAGFLTMADEPRLGVAHNSFVVARHSLMAAKAVRTFTDAVCLRCHWPWAILASQSYSWKSYVCPECEHAWDVPEIDPREPGAPVKNQAGLNATDQRE
jgi:hypothetical protein